MTIFKNWLDIFHSRPKLNTLSYPARCNPSDVKQVIKAASVKTHINNYFSDMDKTIEWCMPPMDREYALYDKALVAEKHKDIPRLPAVTSVAGWPVSEATDCEDTANHIWYWLKRTCPSIPICQLSWFKKATSRTPAKGHRFSVIMFSDYSFWLHNSDRAAIDEAYIVKYGII